MSFARSATLVLPRAPISTRARPSSARLDGIDAGAQVLCWRARSACCRLSPRTFELSCSNAMSISMAYNKIHVLIYYLSLHCHSSHAFLDAYPNRWLHRTLLHTCHVAALDYATPSGISFVPHHKKSTSGSSEASVMASAGSANHSLSESDVELSPTSVSVSW